MKNLKKSIGLFLVLAIVLTLRPIESNAKWREMDSNLPGSDGPTTGQIVLVAGVGVLAIGALSYFLISKHKKQKEIAQTVKFNTLNLSFNSESSWVQKFETAGRNVPVDIIIAPNSSVHNLALGNTNGIQVGLKIRF